MSKYHLRNLLGEASETRVNVRDSDGVLQPAGAGRKGAGCLRANGNEAGGEVTLASPAAGVQQSLVD